MSMGITYLTCSSSQWVEEGISDLGPWELRSMVTASVSSGVLTFRNHVQILCQDLGCLGFIRKALVAEGVKMSSPSFWPTINESGTYSYNLEVDQGPDEVRQILSTLMFKRGVRTRIRLDTYERMDWVVSAWRNLPHAVMLSRAVRTSGTACGPSVTDAANLLDGSTLTAKGLATIPDDLEVPVEGPVEVCWSCS